MSVSAMISSEVRISVFHAGGKNISSSRLLPLKASITPFLNATDWRRMRASSIASACCARRLTSWAGHSLTSCGSLA